jgi:hypothetical protein
MVEGYTMAAHPTDSPGRDTNHQGIIGHVFRHHGPRSHEAISPEGDAADNRGIGSDGCPATQEGLLIEIVPDNLGAGVRYIRENATGSEKTSSSMMDPGRRRHCTEILTSLPNHNAARDTDVLARIHTLADLAPFMMWQKCHILVPAPISQGWSI